MKQLGPVVFWFKNHFSFSFLYSFSFSKHFDSSFYTVQMRSFLFLFYLVRESF